MFITPFSIIKREMREIGHSKIGQYILYLYYHFKGELNPKIKFVLFERTHKITEKVIFKFLIGFVFDIFQFL